MNDNSNTIQLKDAIEPEYPWPRTEREEKLISMFQAKQREFPWYSFLTGVATGTLIWTFIFMMVKG